MNAVDLVRSLAAAVPKPTILDRLIGYVSPEAGLRRMHAATMLGVLGGSGGYTGARGDRPSMQEWRATPNSPDSDTLYDLPTLRGRGRDLVRNTPIATGALSTQVLNVVGPGLTMQPALDREALGLTDDAADLWERRAARYFATYTQGVGADLARRLSFGELQGLTFRSQLDSGDVLILRRDVPRPGDPFSLRLQVIEADRVCNPDWRPDTDRMLGGVEVDENGAPVAYHVLNQFPGDYRAAPQWSRVLAYGPVSGEAQTLFLAAQLRPGQTRGVPYLAPVIETLKQLARYSDAELAAAVVSSFFTVFIKKPQIDGLAGGLGPMTDPTTGEAVTQLPGQLKMAPAAIMDLGAGEEIEIADPKRPNEKFDPFVQAMLRQVGVALDLPFELLVKHFTASYSAAKAALNEAWRGFNVRRTFVGSRFCQPVYEWWLAEAVARGYLNAPGFFQDPFIRAAWSQATWTGPIQGQLNPLDEVRAARERVDGGFSTEARETAQLTGAEWDMDHRQRVKERRARERDGLDPAVAAPRVPGEPPVAGARDAADEAASNPGKRVA